ncbi:hypothetical protein CVT25_010526 [Psilocybe cyanescens]|uniref:Uncharacterized protein n=1 Tax=Psilocybe cyanescens TaxID=93625 RepID=A0A409X2K8_PSICY|nr:hypothetical protein CVT25_010526 [Psilocybe cyanescens]
MTALRVMWIFASVAFASALLASRQPLSTSAQTEYDVIVPDALDSDASNPVQEVESRVGDAVSGGACALGLRTDEEYQGRGGCWKGYCWAGCNTTFLRGGKEWCYTTKTYSQSYRYVTCKSDSECDKTWKCGGPCALF